MGKTKEFIGSDGLPVAETGEWSEDKHEIAEYYGKILCKSMAQKFKRLIYLDLFSGPGLMKVKGLETEVEGCALRMSALKPGFTDYIFCDINPRFIEALKARISKRAPEKISKFKFIVGDCNSNKEKIRGMFPRFSRGAKVLVYSLVDPYGLGDLQFDTIEYLAKYFIDFLVLLPTGMEANRFWKRPSIQTNISGFLGNTSWKSRWDEKKRKSGFSRFFADEFGKSMKSLGYKFEMDDSKEIRLPGKNVRLYHLMFFSKNELGLKYFKESRKRGPEQRELF